MKADATITGMRLRTHFSLHHAQASAFHARQAAKIELDGTEEASIPLGAHVIAAVISSGAFIEATVNEVTESDGRPRHALRGQPGALLRLNEHLESRGAAPIALHDRVWLSAKTLMDLRHRLVHYTHDWLDEGTNDLVGFTSLRNSVLLPRLLAEFTFLAPTTPYIPRFLSPDCAAWSIKTATTFLDEFFSRLGIPAYHDHIRHRIEV